MYHPTFRQLKYLVAISKNLHFGKAAKECFVSQSTLSSGIQELERLLNVKLIERTKRTVFLTPLGKEIGNKSLSINIEMNDVLDLAKSAEEHMFGGEYLDAVYYGDERDASLDSDKVIDSTKLGFQTDTYIFNSHGKGDAELDMTFSRNEKVDFVILTNGSPVTMKFIFKEDNGEERESKFMDKRPGQGHQFQYYQSFGFNKMSKI